MKKDELNAVEMTRRIRDTHYAEIKDKSWEEQIAFYREKALLLQKKLDELAERDQEAKAE